MRTMQVCCDHQRCCGVGCFHRSVIERRRTKDSNCYEGMRHRHP